jgi:hypothetical protein
MCPSWLAQPLNIYRSDIKQRGKNELSGSLTHLAISVCFDIGDRQQQPRMSIGWRISHNHARTLSKARLCCGFALNRDFEAQKASEDNQTRQDVYEYQLKHRTKLARSHLD